MEFNLTLHAWILIPLLTTIISAGLLAYLLNEGERFYDIGGLVVAFWAWGTIPALLIAAILTLA